MNEVQAFVKLSKYAGERFDIVQAGGGNSSVKLADGTLLIKASGLSLSEVEESSGYAKVVNKDLLDIMENPVILEETDKEKRDKIIFEKIFASNCIKNVRPSIESLLHALLKKYTLHTHPIIVNSITCQQNWTEILSSLDFCNHKTAFIDYKTPGFDLAIELKKIVKDEIPDIIFLKNHGLIVTASSYEKVISLTDMVLQTLERYLNANLETFKLTNVVSAALNDVFKENKIALLSCDTFLTDALKQKKNLFQMRPFCPDKVVYCGTDTCFIETNLVTDLCAYQKKHADYPRVIIYKNNLFFIANNVKKAKEIEDVFKFHIMSLDFSHTPITCLTDEEIRYISNWEAEKYRQKV